MKKLLIISLLIFSANLSSENKNYDELIKRINVEISAQKSTIATINKSLKTNPNDVQLHKQLVYATTRLDSLNNRCKKIKKAKSLYKKLTSENKKFDKMKVKLLNLKEESKKADEEIDE